MDYRAVLLGAKVGSCYVNSSNNTARSEKHVKEVVNASRAHIKRQSTANLEQLQVTPVARVNGVQESFTPWSAKRRITAATAAEKTLKMTTTAKMDAEGQANDVVVVPIVHPQKKSTNARRQRRKKGKQKKPSISEILTTQLTDADEKFCIDRNSTPDEFAVGEYLKDIYDFYREAEVQNCVVPNYNVCARKRMLIVDWLTGVHEHYALMPETLFLAINIFDRYLSTEIVSEKILQLVGGTAMLIAAKYEEKKKRPRIQDMMYAADYAYTKDQMLAMERTMLNVLEFKLTIPTPYVFIVRFLKAASSTDCKQTNMEQLVFFLAELSLHEYAMVKYAPSHLAAAAIYAANHILGRKPCWTPSLCHHSGYSEDQLIACANMMMELRHNACKLQKPLVVLWKYRSGCSTSANILGI